MTTNATYESDRRPHRMGGVAKKIGFTAALFCLLLVAAEVGLRHVYFPPPPRPFRPDAGTSGGYHALLQHVDRIYKDGRWVRAYRGRTYTREKTSRFRVVCLGGSTTWGHHLDASQTWPLMLEQRLLDDGVDVEVINAGRPWYTTAHSIANYATQMRYYHPDVVVIMHGVNDLVRSFPEPGEPPPEWDYGSYQGPMRNVLKGYRAYNRETSWAAWSPLKLVRSTAIYQLARGSETANVSRKEIDLPLDGFATLEPFREHLGYLTRLAGADGCRVVLATQAYVYERADLLSLPRFESTMRETYMKTASGATVSAESVRNAMRAITEATVDTAQRLGVSLADAGRGLGEHDEYFVDDFHLNAGGNAVVANVIHDTLRPILHEMQRSSADKAPVARRSPSGRVRLPSSN